jgi:hypothetical protein
MPSERYGERPTERKNRVVIDNRPPCHAIVTISIKNIVPKKIYRIYWKIMPETYRGAIVDSLPH